MDKNVVSNAAEKLIAGITEAFNRATATVNEEQRPELAKLLRRYFPDAGDIKLSDDGTATMDAAEYVVYLCDECMPRKPERQPPVKVRGRLAVDKRKMRSPKGKSTSDRTLILLGNKATQLRKELKLTQAQVADRINALRGEEVEKLKQYTISYVERGMPSKQLDVNALIEFLNTEKQKLAE